MEFNGTFFATIITFIVFVFVMNKILYAPILKIMEDREEFIRSNYKEAESNNVKTEELSEEKEAKLNEAKDDARDKYVETIDGFKARKSEILQDAQDKANDELEQSRNELRRVSDEVKQGLKNSMSELANDIVEKVIGYRSNFDGFNEDTVNNVLWGEDK